LRDDPAGYLSFVEGLLVSNRFDVLLPTHEQGFLFARIQERLKLLAGLALPSFENYRIAHSKAGFSRLLGELGLPQPATSIVTSVDDLRASVSFPAVIKTSIGTASRGIFVVRNASELDRAVSALVASGAFAGEILVQQWLEAATEKAQSVFCRGELIAFHAFRQIALGVGGGEAVKESVRRPQVRAILAAIGKHLGWHGALSIDYLMAEHDSTPRLIDCNPRLVEPMSAYLAGLDLVGLLLRLSVGEAPAALPESREGVRTRLAIQALLGCASRGGTRRDVLRESLRLLGGQAPYAGAAEELTPVALDWTSALPLALIMLLSLVRPKSAVAVALGGMGAHLLSLDSIRMIESADFGVP
jgi:predicted ATP-grasp superfamily ATP-dependent carboligase